jgi:hypothetical protein
MDIICGVFALTGVTVRPDYAINYEKIQVGNTVRSTAEFRDASDGDSLVDPDAVFLDVQDPSDNEATYQYGVDSEVDRASLGSYFGDILLDEPGYWYFRWYTTGDQPVSHEVGVYAIEVETY